MNTNGLPKWLRPKNPREAALVALGLCGGESRRAFDLLVTTYSVAKEFGYKAIFEAVDQLVEEEKAAKKVEGCEEDDDLPDEDDYD